MDKRDSVHCIEDNLFELKTLKLLMESMLKLLKRLLEKLGNDPRYAAAISQEERAGKEFEESFAGLRISDIGKCGGTPYPPRNKKYPAGLSTSPINTPKPPARESLSTSSQSKEDETDPDAIFFPMSQRALDQNEFRTPKKEDMPVHLKIEALKSTDGSHELSAHLSREADNEQACIHSGTTASSNELPPAEQVIAAMALAEEARQVSSRSKSSKGKNEEEETLPDICKVESEEMEN